MNNYSLGKWTSTNRRRKKCLMPWKDNFDCSESCFNFPLGKSEGGGEHTSSGRQLFELFKIQNSWEFFLAVNFSPEGEVNRKKNFQLKHQNYLCISVSLLVCHAIEGYLSVFEKKIEIYKKKSKSKKGKFNV